LEDLRDGRVRRGGLRRKLQRQNGGEREGEEECPELVVRFFGHLAILKKRLLDF
jgi:hypothetical protein